MTFKSSCETKNNFSKILDHLTWTISQPGYLKPFRSLFVKKTNSCRISKKSVRFELQVHDLMLMIFYHPIPWEEPEFSHKLPISNTPLKAYTDH